MNAFPLLRKLVACGYLVQITQGRLSVTDVRNHQRECSRKEEDQLLLELGRLLSTTLLSYENYSCGLYTVKAETKSPGLTLHMKKHGYPQESAYSVLNVSTTYERSGKNHKAGDPLPKGRFIAQRQGNFVRFWLACGLELPDDGKVSAFHKYMGKLRPVIVSGVENPRHPERYNNLSPLTISADVIKAELSAKQALTRPLICPNTSLAPVPKDFHLAKAERNFQASSGTCPKSTVKGQQEKVNHGEYRAVKEGTRIFKTESPASPDRISDDWWQEYNAATKA
jgi:hypothetical protein